MAAHAAEIGSDFRVGQAGQASSAGRELHGADVIVIGAGFAGYTAARELGGYGVTSDQAMQGDVHELASLRRLEATGRLAARVNSDWDYNTPLAPTTPAQTLEYIDRREECYARSALIDPDGSKIYADGVPVGGGSPYFEPYSGGSGSGRPLTGETDLASALIRMDRRGLSS